MNDLISVIIPVYNVEPYIRKCLDSVVGQTHKNLEIILVDDGSTDNSGVICDEYRARDSRIKVIHKANGGVSSARNAGLAAVTGSYIGWVDSDDWIEPDMFEYLLSGLLRHNADISVCGRTVYSPDKTEAVAVSGEESFADQVGFFRLVAEDRLIRSYLWDKLFRAELFSGIAFPKLTKYEDMSVLNEIIFRISGAALLPECKYNYLLHSGSLTNAVRKPEEVWLFFEALIERLRKFRSEKLPVTENMDRTMLSVISEFLFGVLSLPRRERIRYIREYRSVAAFFNEYYRPEDYREAFGAAGRMILSSVRRHPDKPPMTAVMAAGLYNARRRIGKVRRADD